MIRTVRAVLGFKTPFGKLKKDVNWSCYESKASLTTSTTSIEAYNRFLINTSRIINSSKMELKYLDSIYFYESYQSARGKSKNKYITKTLKIEKDLKPVVVIK